MIAIMSNIENMSVFISGIITILGTVLGAVVGWLLGKGKKAKINLEIDETKCEFHQLYKNGLIVGQGEDKYIYFFRLRVYNSGDQLGIMKNFRMKFEYKQMKSCEAVVYQADSIKYSNINSAKRFDLVNAFPKVAVDYYCACIVDYKPNDMATLFYQNEKKKIIVGTIILN